MPWRWGKRLILHKAPRPYRVLVIGEDETAGIVGQQSPPGVYADGIGYVDRMAQRMGPYYEFLNAGAEAVSVRDHYFPEDADHPGDPKYGGAYELLVQPLLEAATGNQIDMAVVWCWWTDAVEYDGGVGRYEDGPAAGVIYWVYLKALATRLLEDHVNKVLLITPIEWEHVGYPKVSTRLEDYRDVIFDMCEVGDDPQAALAMPVSVGCLDIWHVLDQEEFFAEYGSNLITQQGHDRLAAVIGRKIRQSTHYRFMREPGRAGIDAPFIDWADWQPDLPV